MSVEPTPPVSDALRFWETPELTGVNRLPGRAWTLPYEGNAAAAVTGHDTGRPTVLSLDGEWAFRMVEQPERTVPGFPDPSLDDSDWDRVTVPGNFTMQGYDHPHYTNIQMPFAPNRAPHVPRRNPTGLYRRTFEVPNSWVGKRIVLQLGAVGSCAAIWLNGYAVGVAKDSRLPSEFEVTRLLVGGPNVLAVQVIRWSDASYLEDQDQWWQAGLNRSVSLYATCPVYLADVATTAGYDVESGDGQLNATVTVGNLPSAGWSVTTTVLDRREQPVLELSGEPAAGSGDLPANGEVRFAASIPSVLPWSAETPELYTLVVALTDPAGTVVESTRVRIGFRTVEVRDRQLLVNGRPITLRGVNRHEHHDRLGSVVPASLAEQDVQVLKAFNVNAVRTSHYPPDPYFLELCDTYGLYVVDEANIETHANTRTICDDPRYQAAFLDRVSRMVARDRNHPSIIMWSLGNESGYGRNHDAAAAWVRRTDPSRALHYEGAISEDWAGGHTATDVVCPMYPSIDAIVEWAEKSEDWRPLIMCEYSHAMGNSNGSLADYWEAIRSREGLQGGFIWEMLDHGIAIDAPDGNLYWGYGGDFGDHPHDGNFVCDGLFWPDRRPHPAMWEVKRVYQPFDTELAGDELRVTNGYDFRDLSHLRITWELLIDGQVVDSGEVPTLRTPAGETEAIDPPWPTPDLQPGQEAHGYLRFADSQGHEVGWTEHFLTSFPSWPAEVPSEDPPETSDSPERAARGKTSTPRGQHGGEQAVLVVADATGGWTVSGQRVSAMVRGGDGVLLSLVVDGKEILTAGPVPSIFRAPTDNDGIQTVEGRPSSDQALYHWRRAGLHDMRAEPLSVNVEHVDGGHRVLISRSLRYRSQPPGGEPGHGYTYTERLQLRADGVVEAWHAFDIDEELTDLPRIGVVAVLPAGFETLEWFGRGPHESYPDRKTGAAVRRWSSTVDEQYVPYILPQEHGNLTDVRWLALTRAGGQRVTATAVDGVLQAKASHYSDESLAAARHTIQLVREDVTYLSLNAAVRGLGTGSCGPDTLERYRIHGGRRYELSYRLLPEVPARQHSRPQ